MDDLKAQSDADKRRAKLSPEEIEHRRTHVRIAVAENRIEGMEVDAATQEICDLYIRGDIGAGDLVTAYVKRPPQLQP